MKLKFDLPEEKIRTTVKLKKSSIDTLNYFREYQTKVLKVAITNDNIIDALVENINRDKDFIKFKEKQSRIGATSENKKKQSTETSELNQPVEN
jgi:hypothetical protein